MIHASTQFETRNSIDDPPFDGGIDDLLDLAFEHRSIATRMVAKMAFQRRFPIISEHMEVWA